MDFAKQMDFTKSEEPRNQGSRIVNKIIFTNSKCKTEFGIYQNSELEFNNLIQ